MKTPEEILKLPQMQEFFGNPDVQAGIKIASEHRYCHEYQALMEQGQHAMIELANAIKAHAETCTNKYICDAPCCFTDIDSKAAGPIEIPITDEIESLERKVVPTGSGETFLPL